MSAPFGRRLPTANRAHCGVLAPEDVVRVHGCTYTVTALSGTRVHLMPRPGEQGAPMVASLPVLAAAPDFTVLGPAPSGVGGQAPEWTRMQTISEDAARDARIWERHIVEVATGVFPDALDGTPPRPGYDPARFALIERYQTKAAELTAVLDWQVSWQTVQRKRLAYAKHGVWGLVDKRRARAHSLLGRTDPRVAELLQERVRQQQDAGIDITADKLFTDLRRIVHHRLGKHMRVPTHPTLYKLLARLGYDARNLSNPNRGRNQRPGRPRTPYAVTRADAPGALVQIDSTALDVKVLGDDGRPAHVELTAAIDVFTRSIIAAVVRTKSLRHSRARRGRRKGLVEGESTRGRATKAVDASLLLADALVPAPMRPGYRPEAGADHSDLPYAELVEADERFATAIARPVIVPEVIVIDHGTVFVTRTFIDACTYLGISVRPSAKRTPTDKAIVERTFGAIKSMFSQRINSYTGRNFARRAAAIDPDRLWTLQELNDLLQQWIAMGWQNHAHDELRDPRNPSAPPLTPNQMYAVAVQAAGYLPIPLGHQDYLRLLPTAWVGVRDQGIRFRHRTYDNPSGDLEFCRNMPSGLRGRHKDQWEIRYSPYTPERIWLHDHTGQSPTEWVEAFFTRQHELDSPWTEYWWQLAADEFVDRGGRRDDEDGVTQVLREMMERAGHGPDQPAAVFLPDGYGPHPPGHAPVPFDPYADVPPIDLGSLGTLADLDDDPSLYAPQPPPRPGSPGEVLPGPPPAAGEGATAQATDFDQSWWAGLPALDELGTADPSDIPLAPRPTPPPGDAVTPDALDIDASDLALLVGTRTASIPHPPWLDTLANWRSLVAMDRTPPDLADAPPPGVKPADNDRRLRYHGLMPTVPTPAISRARLVVHQALMVNREREYGKTGVIIEGPRGTGKSEILRSIGLKYEQRISDLYEPDENRIPVIALRVPPLSRGGHRNWPAAFARFLGLQRDGGPDPTSSITYVMRHSTTLLVLIDGIEQLRAGSDAEATFAYLEEISETTGATFVYAGRAARSIVDPMTRDRETSLNKDEELWGDHATLRTERIGYDIEGRTLFAKIVHDFDTNLRLHHHHSNDLTNLAPYLHKRSKGYMRALTHLISHGAQRAILTGQERITEDLMDTVALGRSQTI